MPPPAPSIQDPITFAEWSATHALYNNGLSSTETTVYAHETIPDKRYAYGLSSQGFWFFIEMTDSSQESEFWQTYMGWRVTQSGSHTFASLDKPPTCGTPNTPSCPPDDVLRGRIRDLRDTLAGPGATPEALLLAELKVHDLLISTLDATKDLIE